MDLEALVASLKPGEKAQILQMIVTDLGDTAPGIESQPEVAGGEP